jgi:23S rRNA (adenine2503-C2)-methyltransferase
MCKENLMGYTRSQMEQLMSSLGEKPFKGRQLFKWIYRVRQYDFDLMTDLSKTTRGQLEEKYTFRGLHAEHVGQSTDGTYKILFRLSDGHPIETVLIPDEDKRRTACTHK